MYGFHWYSIISSTMSDLSLLSWCSDIGLMLKAYELCSLKQVWSAVLEDWKASKMDGIKAKNLQGRSSWRRLHNLFLREKDPICYKDPFIYQQPVLQKHSTTTCEVNFEIKEISMKHFTTKGPLSRGAPWRSVAVWRSINEMKNDLARLPLPLHKAVITFSWHTAVNRSFAPQLTSKPFHSSTCIHVPLGSLSWLSPFPQIKTHNASYPLCSSLNLSSSNKSS